ncbi:hypothetical protein B0H17DRAFT_1126867 [Mycena rosella]|uniref:Uncharacterized protein n=1 Tax=Mycena rosella TaxID=1033263 RepID=A0AAD7GT35_MYCRO|nr:hypothetical protein B0H17DRAFT_1126867 [Mycena rosella]
MYYLEREWIERVLAPGKHLRKQEGKGKEEERADQACHHTSIHRFSGSSKKAALISSKWPGKVSLKPKGPTRVTMSSRAAQDKQRSKAATEHQIQMENLEPQEQEVLDALADFERDYGDDEEIIQVNDVLDGTSRAEMSHGGGEFEDAIWQDLESERQRQRPKHPDWRTRRD